MNKNDGDTHEVQRSTLLEIAARLEEAAASASSATMSKRAMTQSLTERLAIGIANHPDVRRSVYVKVLVTTGYYQERNAQKIVKKAYDKSRSIAASRPYTEAAKPTVTSSSVVSNFTNRELVNTTQSNRPTEQTPISDRDLSEYVLKLPQTLPRPTRIRERDNDIKRRGFFNLKSTRNELFTKGFTDAIKFQVKRTPDNPDGNYQLAASNAEKQRYGAIWDAIGHSAVPPTWFPAILPYLAEEGLLEYHQVGIDLVRTFEEQRQDLIRLGQLPEYNRNAPFFPQA